ncbi:DUF4292 domain-containing protein [uncultured Microscilla sp.]|uniref:DUF4292 domain-containing protein n=1 Tax=uncultured Microscilla sp. TaxID=432653 RepID=UPI002628B1A7|nr:DUF4292 domain-containing protein [uncultured Microscilla sp.]
MYITKKIYSLGFIALFGCILFSCKSNKTALTTRHKNTPIDSVLAKETKFAYLKSKFKLHFHDAERDVKAKVRLRLKKDSLIWVSVSKTGFEGLRGMITRDSIYVLDRMKKVYQVSDFKTLSKNFNFDINFDLLQSMILGNMPFRGATKSKIVQNEKYWLIKQKRKHIDIENYVNNRNRKLEQVLLTDIITNNSLRMVYEDYAAYNDKVFPGKSSITVKYKSKQKKQNLITSVSIKYLKVEFTDEEIKFPFRVSKKYKRE